MSEDFDKYLAIANHDIQMAKDMGELKSYVASLLYDNDKKGDMVLEYQEKIDKAIEYIESYMPNYDFDKTNLIKLLEILDKEEVNWLWMII